MLWGADARWLIGVARAAAEGLALRITKALKGAQLIIRLSMARGEIIDEHVGAIGLGGDPDLGAICELKLPEANEALMPDEKGDLGARGDGARFELVNARARFKIQDIEILIELEEIALMRFVCVRSRRQELRHADDESPAFVPIARM